ncbi:type IV pilin protein [Archangium lipolyticum]|uniref:type IV pilin protein n=1 Tax=Archangium lipolyticum TaxID=2970465 RepID=UPI0027D44F64|nr:prepilin-type N-terminal cleavage/methylation domain-containing protein [Archangium lipolyticum]
MAHPTLHRRKHQGFTLIELMIVVGIIGLLASVAIPQMQSFQMRTKRAERDAMITSLIRTVSEYWSVHNSLPGGLTSLAQNPAGTEYGTKKPFDKTLPGWATLGWQPDGLLYYTYDVTKPQDDVLEVTAKSDLDHDGVLNVRIVRYKLRDGLWQWDSEIVNDDITF